LHTHSYIHADTFTHTLSPLYRPLCQSILILLAPQILSCLSGLNALEVLLNGLS